MRPLPHLVRRTVAILLAGLAPAVGCRAVVDRAFQRPTLTFRGAALRDVGPNGGTLDVYAVIHNPNPIPLRAAQARYRLLTADSVEVGRGETVDALAVGARDSAELRLPVAVSWSALARGGAGALAQAAAGGGAEYRVLGDVVLTHTPVGDVSVPLDVRGRAAIRVPGLPGLFGPRG